jgi:hypothetical protein
MLSVIMLNVIYAECHNLVHYAECCYAACHHAVYCYVVCHYTECIMLNFVMLSVIMLKSLYA